MNNNNIIWEFPSPEITKICRVCLIVDKNNKDIFEIDDNVEDPGNSSFSLQEKVQMYCGIQIIKDEGLPSTICNDCIIKVNNAHELWKQCRQVDGVLKNFQDFFKSQTKNTEISSLLLDDSSSQERGSRSLESGSDSPSKKLEDTTENIQLSQWERSSSSNETFALENINPDLNFCKQDNNNNNDNNNDENKNSQDDTKGSDSNSNSSNNFANYDIKNDACNPLNSSEENKDIHNISYVEESVISEITEDILEQLEAKLCDDNNNTIIKCRICKEILDSEGKLILHLNKHKVMNLLSVYYILREKLIEKQLFEMPDNAWSLYYKIEHIFKYNKNKLLKVESGSMLLTLVNIWIKIALNNSDQKSQHFCTSCDKIYLSTAAFKRHFKKCSEGHGNLNHVKQTHDQDQEIIDAIDESQQQTTTENEANVELEELYEEIYVENNTDVKYEALDNQSLEYQSADDQTGQTLDCESTSNTLDYQSMLSSSSRDSNFHSEVDEQSYERFGLLGDHAYAQPNAND